MDRDFSVVFHLHLTQHAKKDLAKKEPECNEGEMREEYGSICICGGEKWVCVACLRIGKKEVHIKALRNVVVSVISSAANVRTDRQTDRQIDREKFLHLLLFPFNTAYE